MTLLTLVQEICDEIGVQQPTAVISNTNQTIRQILQMAQREGRNLVKSANWTILQRLHTFTTDGSEEYALPADYSRLLDQTDWDRSENRPLVGPVNPQDWQEIKSGLLGTGLAFVRYRIYRASGSAVRKIYVDPADSSGAQVAFEYISSYWCTDSGGTAQAAWAADDDLLLLDEDVYKLGVIVRFKRAKGLDFASEADEYQLILDREKGQDRPAKTLNMAGSRSRVRLLTPWNSPETGLGS